MQGSLLKTSPPQRAHWLWLTLALLCAAGRTAVAGSGWIPLQTTAPAGIETMLLLPDGTVMAQDGGVNWYRLTPGSGGGYTNGTWTMLSPMKHSRLYFSSQVLSNGTVFVAGAEYGTGTTNAELYHIATDSWSDVPIAAGVITTDNVVQKDGSNNRGFIDSGSFTLPDGTVMILPVRPGTSGYTAIYNPVANNVTQGPKLYSGGNEDEASTVKLADASILVVDSDGQTAERFIPSLNRWIPDMAPPVQLFDQYGGESGAAFLLPNGKAFFIGSTPYTAIYTPGGGTNQGTWQPGPNIPRGLGAPDAPAAMMVNGKVLCALSPTPFAQGTNINVFTSPISFYEYDYSVGTVGAFTPVPGPNDNNTNAPTYWWRMLDLPDGTVLATDHHPQLYVYKPDSGPLAAGQPNVNGVGWNADGTIHLSGTLFNGITQGAAYGDDAQMDSNYPLVRFSDGAGDVYYGTTFGWSSTGVQTGSQILTTAANLPWPVFSGPGAYSLQVVANGNASPGVLFYGPVWVNSHYASTPQNGAYYTPYTAVSQAVSGVVNGATVAVNASQQPSTFHTSLTISKPMTIISVFGPTTIGL